MDNYRYSEWDGTQNIFEPDADALMVLVKNASSQAVSINEGLDNEEISFCDYELCGHDEGKPCTKLERLEIRNQ